LPGYGVVDSGLAMSTPSTPPTVIYVAGSGRSGSTLLDLLLGEREGIVSCGQVYNLWVVAAKNHYCGCGERAWDCPFWGPILHSMDLDGLPLDEVRLDLREATRPRNILHNYALSDWPRSATSKYDRILSRLPAVYKGIREQSGASVIVDSSKKPAYLAMLAKYGEVDVKVVHLVRDARGVAFSWTKKKRITPEESQQVLHLAQYAPAATALRWWVNVFPGLFEPRRSLRVRYEDLAADPDGVVDQILDATLGEVRRKVDGAGTAHIIDGNPIRLERGPRKIKVDEAWRRDMPLGQRVLVSAINAPLLLRYGYSIV